MANKNVVLISVDSLRQDHIGAYGNNWIKTPHLDRFAAESIRYTRCYPETMPTLPMRRGLYTGKKTFPFRELAGPFRQLYYFPGWGPIPPDEVTVSEAFREAGYKTGLVSDLWHFFKPNINFHRGFSSYHFIRGQEADNFRNAPRLSDAFLESHIPESHKKNEKVKFFLRRFMRNNYGISEEGRSTSRVFQRGAQWIDDHWDSDSFFLVLESFTPHEPWMPPEKYRRLYDDDDDGATDCVLSPYAKWPGLLSPRELKRIQANYAGSVTWLDRWFGYFMEALKYSGRLEDTVVVVITDHGHNIGLQGDQDYISKQGHPSTRGVNDLALMIRHPDGHGAGRVSDLLCQHYDLSRTMMEMAGLDPVEGMDGFNIWDAAQNGASGRDYAISVWGTVLTAVSDRWWFNGSLYGEGFRLFDNDNDFYHTRNLAEKHPEIARQMLDRAIEDAGGWSEIPEEIAAYKSRVGCGVGGFSPDPYGTAVSIDLNKL